LANYFKVSVAWLRGEITPSLTKFFTSRAESFWDRTEEVVELYDQTPDHLKSTVLFLAQCFIEQIAEFIRENESIAPREDVAIYMGCIQRLEELVEKRFDLSSSPF
jgi:hypothetical protein